MIFSCILCKTRVCSTLVVLWFMFSWDDKTNTAFHHVGEYQDTRVKEAIHIRTLKPSLDRDRGRDTTYPRSWNNIIMERLTESVMGTANGGGGGGAVWGILLAYPVVSNTIQKWRHTEESCRDSWKLCKLSKPFYPVVVVKNICMCT